MATARDAQETRRLLVEAGIMALRELTTTDLVTAVGTREIARRAGVSAATLFNHFGSVEAFAGVLLERIYDPDTSPVGVINSKVGEVITAGLPIDAGLDLHRSEFLRLMADPEHRLRVGLWAFGGDAARDAYGHYVRVSDGHIVRQSEKVFASWGREIRPPFDATMFIAAQAALLTGSVIRHTTDPEATDVERFARIASVLSIVMLRMPGDRRDIDDRLAEINYYPLQGAAGSTSQRSRTTRTRILEAAGVLFRRQSYEETSIAQVAREAHVSPTTVYGVVESKPDLAIEVLLHEAQSLVVAEYPEGPDGPDGPDGPGGPDGLEASLLAVGGFLAARATYAEPYVARLAVGALPAEGDPLVAVVTAGLAAAQSVGTIGADVVLTDVAPTMLLVLAGRTLGDPSEGAPGAARHVLGVMVRGLAR